MIYPKLKRIRVLTALFFFILLSALFLDIHGIFNTQYSDYVLSLQFIPSIINFVSIPSILAAGFIVILILTVFYGRVYCSFLCPLGILMDSILFIKRKFAKKKRDIFDYQKPQNIWRYSVLAITVISLFAGSLIVILLLDPYSNFGRIITQIFRPPLEFANNILVYVLEVFDYYEIKPVDYSLWQPFAFSFSVMILAIVVFLTIISGRLFCNTLCPVGITLGLFSKFSLFKINVDELTCTGCGLCEKVCKAQCIDSSEKQIDFDRCVACYNCFDSCPTIGLVFRTAKKQIKSPIEIVDIPKRNFIIALGAFFLSNSLIVKAQEKINVYVKNKIPVYRVKPISPPGSISIANMIEKCTACQMCVSACPTKVLQPSFLDYGLTGMMVPKMDNVSGFCNYDCTICGEVCPTDAILPTKIEEKKLIQIGKVILIKDNCVVYTQKTDCGACAEHCPTKSVRMEIDDDVKLRAPFITQELCIGCGACEYICPTIPYKSIYVESNQIHLAAKPPEKIEAKPSFEVEDDFPF